MNQRRPRESPRRLDRRDEAVVIVTVARSGDRATPLTTPDGRYLVVRGRLWRCADPGLDAATRADLTKDLMAARRAKGTAMRAGDDAAREIARQRVDAAKHALGERGPVWWTDGAPDLNRKMARNTVYADWFARVGGPEA